MSQEKWAALALESFDSVVASIPGFRSRDGQRRMADQVAASGSHTGQALEKVLKRP